MRDHFVTDYPLCVCVRNRSFEAVSDSYEYLAGRCCLGLYKYHDSVVELLGSYSPVQTDAGRIFRCIISFQIRYCHDSYLVGRRVVEGHEHIFQMSGLL